MWKLLLLTLISVVNAKNSFLILAPKTISPSTTLRLGVNSLNATQDLTVTARVQTQEWSNYPYYHYEQIYVDHANTSDSVMAGDAGVVELKVPQHLKPDNYILKVQVETTSGEEHVKSYNLQYYSKYLSTFIQTDKAMYKPGSLVNFRAFAVYSDLLTYTGNMTIEMFDPSNNKLMLMKEVIDPSGVVTRSFKLSAMPILGHWKIRVSIPDGPTEEKTFEVSNYKLPRFEVTVDVPSFALVTDRDIKGKVSAKYTFGEGVKGVAEIHAKIVGSYSGSCSSEQPAILMSFPLDGESKFTVPMVEVQHLSSYLNGKQLEIQAFVTETLTGKKLNGSSVTTFYSNAIKMKYLDYSARDFKPGLIYSGTMKISLQDDLPLPTPRKNVTIYPCVTYRIKVPNQEKYHSCDSNFQGTYGITEETFPVPADGLVDVKLMIPEDAVSVTITAFYGETSISWTIKKAYSPSDSFLQLYIHDTNVTAGEDSNIFINSTRPLDTVWYEVISRGSFVTAGHVDGGMKKSLNLTLPITPKMAPHARVLVYSVLDDGEVIADSTNFEVKGLFTNKVALEFSKNESQPHEDINVKVSADPQSLVSLLVVDQSVTLLASGNDITSDMVETELKYYDNRGVSNNYEGETDASQVFRDANVAIYTDATIPYNPSGIDYGHGSVSTPGYHYNTFAPIGYTPMPGATPYMGPTPYPNGFLNGMPIPTALPAMHHMTSVNPKPSGVINPQQPLKEVGRVRNFFPETWLWTNTTIGSNGIASISATVPDTITSWLATAFAVNPVSGLGVTDSASKMKVFRPFFVSVDVPMSVIRGEQVVVQASVFNYLQTDLDVMVTMKKSSEYDNIQYDPSTASLKAFSADQVKTVRVASGDAMTVDFPIVPTTLGQLDIQVSARSTAAADAVQRKITVEPEGIRKETNFPVTIDLLSGNTYNKTLSIPLPNYIVKDSQKARVRAFGDVVSPSLDGLDSLLKMPTGCGEQNMMGLAPDVYISNYLVSAKKYDAKIEQKVIPFMEEGFQRELSYQHNDGSYSIWGNSDYYGSTWLTAFVVKTFIQARQYVYIDDQIIARAANWLMGRQNTNGDFHENGYVHSSSLQGGSGHGYALTAFVLDALLEVRGLEGVNAHNLNDTLLRASAFLEFNIIRFDDAYTIAIATHALTKAGSIFAEDAFKKLEHVSKTKDDMMFWERYTHTRSSYWRPYHQYADAIDIETTGYALKTYALRKDFVKGLSVMKWLISTRNPNGGFVSTQDTVVALDALSAFATVINSDSFKISADVSSGKFSKHFEINAKNALDLQATDASEFTGTFNVNAQGHGVGYLEIASFFNVEKPVEEQYFDISQDIEIETLNMYTLRACVSYTKSRTNNMAVVEITVPSGFEPDMESLNDIRNLQRSELLGKNFVFYFSHLESSETCIRFTGRRNGLVAKLQASPIHVFDYYEPTHQAVAFYKPQTLHDATVCEICANCCQKIVQSH
ncbi:CD109 antigen-like [Haliotis rubra]|uniref:CD109 antigen-like n=1 Tax=Haliotis rubra TaxID=36100 RepID=UPI001EE5C816|nr:CD109 antigen-like [Haliotis rubra]XP_046553017.1 CD109 antigen-like [Haliotis rubra]